MANVLKKYKVKKGETVCIYMPMVPQAVISMLACARIGAVHNVVFAGFSAQSLADRIKDSDCRLVITSDIGHRGEKEIPIKKSVEEALDLCQKKIKV
jgi:acetyl-CoA synthetase